MEIKIDLKIFLFLLFFYFLNQVEIYVLLIFFAFLHEIGHLVTGLSLGYEPSRISMNPVGFSINFKEKLANYNTKIKKGTKKDCEEIVIALAGPLTNVGILVVCFLSGIQMSNLYYANILLAIFNLIPIYPLDGGRILKSVGNLFWGRKKSWKITNYVSNAIMISLSVTFSIVILYLHNWGIVLMSIYLWGIVIRENQRYERKMALYEKIEAAIQTEKEEKTTNHREEFGKY